MVPNGLLDADFLFQDAQCQGDLSLFSSQHPRRMGELEYQGSMSQQTGQLQIAIREKRFAAKYRDLKRAKHSWPGVG